MKPLPRTLQPRIWMTILIVVLCGFLVTCGLAYRDARFGYELRVWNRTQFPIEVYLVKSSSDQAQTIHLFDVWQREVNPPYLLERTEVGELVFSPRGTGRRISRIELPTDGIRATGRADGPLFVELHSRDFRITDGREWGLHSAPRVPPEAPLLYIGVIGWLFTLARLWGKRLW